MEYVVSIRFGLNTRVEHRSYGSVPKFPRLLFDRPTTRLHWLRWPSLASAYLSSAILTLFDENNFTFVPHQIQTGISL